MTDQPFPINPPTKLVQQWKLTAPHPSNETEHYRHITICAAQWGSHQRGTINEAMLQERADQELEKCREWVSIHHGPGQAERLRAARRPKPPSLKEQALEALGPEPLPETGPTGDTILNKGSIEHHRTIRRALEALPDA
jgi:hypothetical protein